MKKIMTIVALVATTMMVACVGTDSAKTSKTDPKMVELTDVPKIDVSNGGVTCRELLENEGKFYDIIYTSQENYMEKILVDENVAEVREYRVTYRPMIEKNKLVLFPEMEIMERYYTTDTEGITSKILVNRKSFDLPTSTI